MKSLLHLVIVTPAKVLVDDHSVVAVRATDDSGSFGLLPKHTGLVTALDDSVVQWRDNSNKISYCALRRGVLIMHNGDTVRIACREGLTGTVLSELNLRVRELRAQDTDADREEALRQMRMHTQAMRHIMAYLGTSTSRDGSETITPISELMGDASS